MHRAIDVADTTDCGGASNVLRRFIGVLKRRAFVRAFERLPAEARDAFARNPDPCARQLREMAV